MKKILAKISHSHFCESVAVKHSTLASDCSESHELQAGEHFTRVVWLDYTNEPNDSITQLAHVYHPLRIQVSPQAVHESEAVCVFSDPRLSDRAELAQVRTAALIVRIIFSPNAKPSTNMVGATMAMCGQITKQPIATTPLRWCRITTISRLVAQSVDRVLAQWRCALVAISCTISTTCD